MTRSGRFPKAGKLPPDLARSFLVPLLIALGLPAAYLLGGDASRALLAPQANREFGLIENAQLLLLVTGVFVAFEGRRSAGARSAVWALTALALALVALEEVDYGLHLVDLLNGRPPHSTHVLGVRNLHNLSAVVLLGGKLTMVMGLLGIGIHVLATGKGRSGASPALGAGVLVTAVVPAVWQVLPLPPGEAARFQEAQVPAEVQELLVYYLVLLVLRGSVGHRRKMHERGEAAAA